jgi:hypothetical protein
MTDFKAKTIVCCDCKQPFVFNTDEQRYFLSKLLSEPKRCRDCRRRRRESIIPDKKRSWDG